MRARSWRAVLALPFNALVLVPLAVLWLTRSGPLAWTGLRPGLRLLLGIAAATVGLALLVRTIRLFDRRGEGTLAPWDPPRRLVVEGPYRRVRNPMISGVMFTLAGETLLLGSPGLALWLALFVLANAVYMPLLEEPGLERRFGDDYRRYKAAVPRWIPRLRPWQPPPEAPPAPPETPAAPPPARLP